MGLKSGCIARILHIEDLILQTTKELPINLHLIIDINPKLVLFLDYSRHSHAFSKFGNDHAMNLRSIDSNRDINGSIRIDQNLKKLGLNRSLSGIESVQKSDQISFGNPEIGQQVG